MQELKMFGIVSLISVYIPVSTGDLFRYSFMIYFTLSENKKSGFEPSYSPVRDLNLWRLSFKQEKATKNELRTLVCKNLTPYSGTSLATRLLKTINIKWWKVLMELTFAEEQTIF